MTWSRSFLALSFTAFLVAPALYAQTPAPFDKPAPFEPKSPAPQDDLDRKEALCVYAEGLLHERNTRIFEAVRAFERTVALDPTAAEPLRSLVPLYNALDRKDDALAACRKVLDLDPTDHETWYIYARQLRLGERSRDALDALVHAAACPRLKDNLELSLQVYFDLGVMHEDAQEFAKAVADFMEITRILDKLDASPEHSRFDPKEINAQAAEALERVGRAAIRAGLHDQAIAAFEKAQKKDPARKERLFYNLAQVYQAKNDLRQAQTCLQQYLAIQPQGTDAYRQWIDVTRKLGQADRILDRLREYLERDKHNIALKLLLAEEYANFNQVADAKAIYEELAKDSPSPEVYRGLFKLYKPTENQVGALKILQLLDSTLAEAVHKEDEPVKPAAAAQARAMLQVLRNDPALVGAVLTVAGKHLRGGQNLKQETRYFLAVLAAPPTGSMTPRSCSAPASTT